MIKGEGECLVSPIQYKVILLVASNLKKISQVMKLDFDPIANYIEKLKGSYAQNIKSC